jgi:hypothetical protein
MIFQFDPGNRPRAMIIDVAHLPMPGSVEELLIQDLTLGSAGIVISNK